jgi:hypothetical protein
MASAIALGAGPISPRSGKSDAISTSGLPGPDSTSPHVCGIPYADVAAAELTQAEPSPAASDWTALTLLDSTSPVSTSMCDTVPSMKFAVQIAPAPKERNLTPTPASNVRRTGGRPGSIRHTTPSPSAVAQT